MTFLSLVSRGVAAGAAGTTALNTTTYLDMALRGRPSSSTPQDSVEALADKAGLGIPGSGEKRDNRLSGLGPMLGILAGTGTGALLGLARAAGWRAGPIPTTMAATAIAFAAGNLPMTALGISDPRSWSVADWVSDAIPHLAYGAATSLVLLGLSDGD
ncbi:MAG TPA: hypothetical protein VHX15_12900 [Frankiaceae bacterium]|jgi:hypothetical protein|nr:hypothetical protein [Frankiaceae bacterium]